MRIRRLIIVFVLMLTAFSAAGQSLESLRAEIRRAEEEIRLGNALLEKTRKDRNVTESQLKLIQSRIRNRKEIVASLEKQMEIISADLEANSDAFLSLTDSLALLRAQYASMYRSAYKNYLTNNYLLFLFASNDFNDATRRIAFMRRYNRAREQKGIEIDSMSKRVSLKIKVLSIKKEELNQTRSLRGKEITALGNDEAQYKSTSKTLQAKESKISKDLSAKRTQMQKAQKELDRIIAEEARKSRAKPKTAAEEQALAALSGRFDQNMGKLPYPVRGVVVDEYGTHSHPTQKGLTITNKGINIAAEPGADVRAVFDGTVSSIVFVNGMNNNILVRHGSYLTVYSNLTTVSVKVGDKVSLNQVLGRLPSGDDDSVLHFEIWKESTNLNPRSWLRR